MPTTPTWHASWTRRAQVALIGAFGPPLLRVLGATYRYEIEGIERLQAAERMGRPIHAFWHGRILPGLFYFQRRGIVVITSENFDGEWIARIITRFGYGTARGSSSRGADRALRQLLRDVRDRPVAFTLDGPRGPARVAQPGAAWLSQATGHPLIPFHLEADRRWTARSWDGSQIPRPFARIALVFAEPIVVPRETPDGLDPWCRRIEAALAQCERRCLSMLARD